MAWTENRLLLAGVKWVAPDRRPWPCPWTAILSKSKCTTLAQTRPRANHTWNMLEQMFLSSILFRYIERNKLSMLCVMCDNIVYIRCCASCVVFCVNLVLCFMCGGVVNIQRSALCSMCGRNPHTYTCIHHRIQLAGDDMTNHEWLKADYKPDPPRSSSQHFVFVRSLNDHRLANGHVSPMSSNTFLIAHAMGDVGYSLRYEKDPMGAAIFVRYSKHSDLSFASAQQTFAANSRSVEHKNGANVQPNVRCVRWTERSLRSL